MRFLDIMNDSVVCFVMKRQNRIALLIHNAAYLLFQVQHVQRLEAETAGQRALGASSRSPSEGVPTKRVPLQEETDRGVTHRLNPGDSVQMNALDVCT